MKGFFITIKNGLLDPKHIKAMGGDKGIGTVWLFLWLLDKMTIIDHEIGEGKVLGGKPISYEEIEKDLGISRRTYARWINILRDGKYITTKRTPYGIIFIVHKAFKVFNQKTGEKQRSATKGTSAVVPGKAQLKHQVRHISPPTRGTSNKTTQKDNTIDNTIAIAPQDGAGKQINELIGLFKAVNPSFERLYPNKTERKCLERMVKKHTHEKIKWVIEKLAVTNKIPYAPTITTPFQLEKKLGNLIAFYQRKKAEKETDKIIINTL